MKEDLAKVVNHDDGDGDGVCDASSCDGGDVRDDDHRHHGGACDDDDAPDRTRDLHMHCSSCQALRDGLQ